MFDMTLFLKDLRGRYLMLSSRLFQTFTAAKRSKNTSLLTSNTYLSKSKIDGVNLYFIPRTLE